MNSPSINAIRHQLSKVASSDHSKNATFFKRGVGEYAEKDCFLGVSVPWLRRIAQAFPELRLEEIEELLVSTFNEERFLALLLLIHRYRRENPSRQNRLYAFYIRHLPSINNWNLVDLSAAA
ncbi:MAG: DNA alkylation repair protein, partial [Puniceicoccales bacterium]|nr:DNA alkylation repair protein [Puniceicoccales bacterium]